jgi:type II secretory pathway component GspD/PulD (secretin)
MRLGHVPGTRCSEVNLVKSTTVIQGAWIVGAALMFLAAGSPAPAGDDKTVSVEPGAEALRGKRIEIAAGDITVQQFLHFLADFTGLPVVAEAGAVESTIKITAPIKDADGDLVQAILEANRLHVARKTLPGGKEALEVTSAAAGNAADGREDPAPGNHDSGPDRSPTPENRVFELREEGLAPVKAPRFAERGVGADETVAVVVRLRELAPKDAAAAIVNALSVKGERSPARGLSIAPVAGASKLIVCGRAASVEFVLDLLAALEEPEKKSAGRAAVEAPEEQERVVHIFGVEHADTEETAALLAAFLQASPGRSGRTNVIADPRSRKIIVETMSRRELGDLQALLQELDVPPRNEAAFRTHIFQLKHLKASEIAPALLQLLGARAGGGGAGRRRGAEGQPPAATALVVPHEGTNSLLIQAEAVEFESLRRLLEEMDAPP